MLATGAVNIAGFIDVGGGGSVPGTGGFYGGDPGLPGLGPGGGQPGQAGQWVGPLSLVPIIGGSGGGGSLGCPRGGGGGGAIAIASSTIITVFGLSRIDAGGGHPPNPCPAGSDGAVRLVANSINVSGYIAGAVVRLEAPLGQVSYTGLGTPPVISTVNPVITPTRPPSITIVSIGGYPVPSYSGSSFSTIDLLLPTQLQDPIPVVIQGTNVPVGSPVAINFSGSPSATSTTANLAGTNATSTATVYVSSLNRSTVTFLFVSATFDPALISRNLQQDRPKRSFED